MSKPQKQSSLKSLVSKLFNEGDLAILAYPRTLRHLRGQEVEIIKVEEPFIGPDNVMVQTYVIFIRATQELFSAEESALEKLKPSDTPSTWENCAWRPRR